jgi:hypothetical protein
VPQLQIAPERSRVDLMARPALPGSRLLVEEVTGTVETGTDTDPTTTTKRPGRGTLTIRLRAIVEPGIDTTGIPPWLSTGEPVIVSGEITEALADATGRLTVRAELHIPDRTVQLTGSGRVNRPGGHDGPIEAAGVSLIDPRSLGFALPPLVTFAIHARWRLVLTG